MARYAVQWRNDIREWQTADTFRWQWQARREVGRRIVRPPKQSPANWRVLDTRTQKVCLWLTRRRPQRRA